MSEQKKESSPELNPPAPSPTNVPSETVPLVVSEPSVNNTLPAPNATSEEDSASQPVAALPIEEHTAPDAVVESIPTNQEKTIIINEQHTQEASVVESSSAEPPATTQPPVDNSSISNAVDVVADTPKIPDLPASAPETLLQNIHTIPQKVDPIVEPVKAELSTAPTEVNDIVSPEANTVPTELALASTNIVPVSVEPASAIVESDSTTTAVSSAQIDITPLQTETTNVPAEVNPQPTVVEPVSAIVSVPPETHPEPMEIDNDIDAVTTLENVDPNLMEVDSLPASASSVPAEATHLPAEVIPTPTLANPEPIEVDPTPNEVPIKQIENETDLTQQNAVPIQAEPQKVEDDNEPAEVSAAPTEVHTTQTTLNTVLPEAVESSSQPLASQTEVSESRLSLPQVSTDNEAPSTASKLSETPNAHIELNKSSSSELPIDENKLVTLQTAGRFLSVDPLLLRDLPESIVESIISQATKFETLKSQQKIAEISYEQNINANKNKLILLRKQLDSAAAESTSLRTRLLDAQNIKSTIERDFLTVKSSSSTLSDELTSLRTRLSTYSDEKRQFLENISQKTSEIKDLQSDRERLRKGEVEARKSIINLETQLQKFQSSQISVQMREQSQQQEISLLKKNNEWLDKELKTKLDEFNKFRTEKNSAISTMQADLSSLQSSYQSLKKSHDTLKTQYDHTSKQLNDALIKVKDLQDSQATNEETFRVEMSSQKRLADLWERSAKDAKKRVEEVEILLDSIRQGESQNVSQWKELAQKEKLRADSLAKQISSLENQLETTIVNSEQINGSETPASNKDRGSSSTVVFSPSAKIIADIQKGGGSLVQLYTDFQEAQNRLARERHKNNALREQMNQIMEEMEQHAPAIIAEREENKRLEHELTEMSIQLETALSTADTASEKLKTTEIKVQDYEKETKILSQQLNDLSRQVQNLIIQNDILSHPNQPITPEEHTALQKILNGGSLDDSDTDKLITQRLVLFKNSLDLQRQNANLLKITRELGKKMEEKEKEMQLKLEDVESTAVSDAKKAIESLQAEIGSINTKLGAVTRERDMFRRMLATKSENGVSLAAVAENSSEGQATAQTQHLIKQNETLTANIKNLETEIINVRTDTAATIKELDAKAVALMNERSNLQLQLAKTESQLELSNERQKHLSSNLEIVRSENEDFKKRYRSMEDTLSKQELRTQKLSEDLITSSSSMESIKNEVVNLRAERSIWKSIEERLNKENSELIEERGRLSGLLANSKSLETERSNANAETINRLNSQIAKLESEIVILRKKLDIQVEDIKNISLLKETEAKNHLKRIEHLTTDLISARQSLSEQCSNNEKLKTAHDLVKTQIASAQEKIKALEAASTPDPKSREFALTQQVNSLKKNVELLQSELNLSNKNLEQLREVAKAAETALGDMNNTHDKYKESTDKQLTMKETELASLKKKLEVTTQILNNTKDTYSKLDTQRTKRIQELTEEQKRLQGIVDVLQNSESKFNANLQSIKADLAQQVLIANEARQNYEQELVKHAEAANALKALREEVANSKSSEEELKRAAQTAIEKLAVSETSWESQKFSYEHEIEQLKSRFDETTCQNKLLLDQLESANNRINKNPPSYEDATASDAQLRELVNFLKREKEIVEVKYELNLQETKRLRQKLEQTTASLDDTRLKLERLTEEQKKKENLDDQKKLQDQLNDISILRESNATLRQQSNMYAGKIKTAEGEIQKLRARIEPLEARLRESKVEIEAKEAQIKLVEQEANDWKTRTQNILHKYERIDPKVVADLKEENEKIKKDVANATQSLTVLTAQIPLKDQEISKKTLELQKATGDLAKVNEELKTVVAEQTKSKGEIEQLKEQVKFHQNRFTRVREEFLEKLKKNRASSKAQIDAQEAEKSTLRTEVTNLKAELEKRSNDTKAGNDEVSSLKTELAQVKETLSAKEAELVKSTESKPVNEVILEKNNRIKVLEEEVNKLSDQILELQRNKPKQQPNAEIASLKKQNAEIQDKLAKVSEESQKNVESELIRKTEEIRNAAQEQVKIAVQNYKKLVEEQMKENSNKDNSGNASGGDEAIKKIREEHEEAIKTLKDEAVAEKKKAREMALKESEMRIKLLQSKSEKFEREKNSLMEQVTELNKKLERQQTLSVSPFFSPVQNPMMPFGNPFVPKQQPQQENGAGAQQLSEAPALSTAPSGFQTARNANNSRLPIRTTGASEVPIPTTSSAAPIVAGASVAKRGPGMSETPAFAGNTPGGGTVINLTSIEPGQMVKPVSQPIVRALTPQPPVANKVVTPSSDLVVIAPAPATSLTGSSNATTVPTSTTCQTAPAASNVSPFSGIPSGPSVVNNSTNTGLKRSSDSVETGGKNKDTGGNNGQPDIKRRREGDEGGTEVESGPTNNNNGNNNNNHNHHQNRFKKKNQKKQKGGR